MRNTLTCLLGTAIIALSGCGAAEGTDDSTRSAAPRAASKAAESAVDRDARRITYEGEDGETALDLLREHGYDVQVESSDLGDYVTAIGDVSATRTKFWLFSVDGTMPAVGADAYETKDGERIEWRYGS